MKAGNCLRRKRWVHNENTWRITHHGNRRNVADKIEVELFVECRIDRVGRRSHKERIAVRGGPHDCLGCQVRACSRTVLNNECLPQSLGKTLRDDTRYDIGRPTRTKPDDQAHRPRRVCLRPCDFVHGRKAGSACCQMEKLPAWNIREAPPMDYKSYPIPVPQKGWRRGLDRESCRGRYISLDPRIGKGGIVQNMAVRVRGAPVRRARLQALPRKPYRPPSGGLLCATYLTGHLERGFLRGLAAEFFLCEFQRGAHQPRRAGASRPKWCSGRRRENRDQGPGACAAERCAWRSQAVRDQRRSSAAP